MAVSQQKGQASGLCSARLDVSALPGASILEGSGRAADLGIPKQVLMKVKGCLGSWVDELARESEGKRQKLSSSMSF